ncbi:MAG TPA: hypothetical protein VK179_13690 [Bacteroidales bacterium]|nr:hypothetical protein [Bacteroidales bacterium]
MTTKRISTNRTAVFVIAILVIVIAFLLLGGGQWIKEMTRGVDSINMNHWNWTQILIGAAIGFFLGFISGRRKW